MRAREPDGRNRSWGVLLALLVLAGCQPQQGPPGPRPTPGAGSALTTLDEAAKRHLLAYAHGLEFATAVTATDEQFLILKKDGHPVIGPWISINPEIGSGDIAAESLAAGRIIARVALSGGSQSVTAYWYVDSTAGAWRSVWVVDDPRWGLIPSQLTIHSHPDTSLHLRMPPRSRVIASAYQFDSTGVCTLCPMYSYMSVGVPIPPPPNWCRDYSFSVALRSVIESLPTGLLPRPIAPPRPTVPRPSGGGVRR